MSRDESSIDERIRSAQQHQLTRVDAEVQRRGLAHSPFPEPERGRSPWRSPWTLVVAGAGVVLVIALIGWRPLTTTTVDVVDTIDSAENDVPTNETMLTTVATTSSISTTTTAEQTTTSTAPDTTTTGDTTTSTATPTGAGVASAVCDSGLRAPLEQATLAYTSELKGWERLDDLVDEQNASYFNTDWEPGFDGTVTVELTLAEPVNATEFRVAQNPYTTVDGTIVIEANGQSYPIALSGMGGWRTHTFATPITVDAMSITRNNPLSNIGELIVCVDS